MPTYRRLPSGNWQAGVFHPSGDRYYKTDPLKKVVRDWAEDLEQSIRRGTFVNPNAGKITLEDWWTSWSESRTVARATASKAETHWRLYVLPAFGRWPLATIGHFDVQQWIGRLDKAGTKPEAFATAVRLLVQLLDAAVAAKKIPVNPAKGLKAPTPPKHVDRVLDVEEADALVAAFSTPEDRVFVRLMLEAGLRWQEAAGLHVFRIDRRRRQLRVQEVVERGSAVIKPQPKSEAGSRVVPLIDDLYEALEVLLEAHPTKDGLLFAAGNGKPLNYSNWLNRVWSPAIAKAKLVDPQPTPHDCRHSYGTWLAENGVPPHEIMVLMGHSSMRAVERYLHASDARMDRARAALKARRPDVPAKRKPRGGGKGA